MSETDSKWMEIAYGAIGVFADDGTMDLNELNFLLGLALKDGVIDDDEKRVLRNIFKRVSEAEVTPTVWARIQDVRQKHDI